MLGILNNAKKLNLIQRKPQLKVYNILAILSLLHGCEIWTLKQKNIKWPMSAEMKFMRRTTGYSL
jgi:hypothetical protein